MAITAIIPRYAIAATAADVIGIASDAIVAIFK